MWGWLLSIRYGAHFGPETDRETGIPLLEEGLALPATPPAQRAILRTSLGQLLLGRALRGLQSGKLLARLVTTGAGADDRRDVDRAQACFREVIADATLPREMRSAAEALLALAEAVAGITGTTGSPGGLDFSGLQKAVTAIQEVQRQHNAARPDGIPGLFSADAMAAMDPLDRPVAVMDGVAPEPVARPARSTPVATVAVPDAVRLRADFQDRLGAPGRTLTTVRDLLRPGVPAPDAERLDDLVALASLLVDAPGSGADDHLLLAAALLLRSRASPGGWGEDDGDGDRRAAVRSLGVAAAVLPGRRADAVAVAYRLATLLDEHLPTDESRVRLGNAFAEVTAALRTSGVDVLGFPDPEGTLLLVAATGRFETAPAGRRMPSRVVLTGEVALGTDVRVSYVRTGADLVTLAARRLRPIGEAPVLVVNPRGDRDHESAEAEILRREFYPGAVVFGTTPGPVDGPGDLGDVRAHLHASLLHLGCGVTKGGELELARGTQLGLRRVTADRPASRGGLAVLPPGAPAALTHALLAGPCTAVVVWPGPVPAPIASLGRLRLHAELAGGGSVAAAVHRVRDWLLDPRRDVPAYLPEQLSRVARSTEPGAYATELRHHGLG
jgi:hypothetical protein